MKPKTVSQSKSSSIGLFELAFLALPFLALTPNFFAPPDLSYMGLATQELVFAIAATIFSAIGLWQIVRARAALLSIGRDQLLMFAALAAFILWQLITLFWAPTIFEGLRISGIWLGFGIFFGAGVLTLQKRSALWLHYSLTAVCLILAFSLLYERAKYGYVMLGVFFNHGISSELLVMLVPLQILNYLCSENRLLAITSFAVSGLCLVTLLIGMRRGAIIALIVVLIAIGLALGLKMVRLQSKRRIAVVMVVIMVASIAVGLRFRDEIIFRLQGATRIQNIQDGARIQTVEGGLTTRLRGWITAWEMGKQNPFWGVGNAGYPSLYGSYRRYFVSNPRYADVASLAGAEDFDEIRSPLAHNEYLQIFVELGLIGLLVFIIFWALVINRLWQLWRRSKQPDSHWALGALLGLIAFGISSATSAFSLRYTPGAFLLACLLVIGFARTRPEINQSGSSSRAITLPKIGALIFLAILLIASLSFVGRTFNVYSSQKLHGRAFLRQPPLDFAFYLNNEPANEGLQRRYEQILSLDSENAGARLGYGILLFQMGKPADAIPQIEYALKNGYGRPFTHVLLAFAYEQKGDLAKASQILDDCLASFPQSIFVRASYAEILRKAGKLDQMREQQKAIYSQDERLAQSWELALKMRPDEAIAAAKQRGLIPPNELRPELVARLVGMRAFHYLK
jgi:O-antigen ligase